MNLYTDKLPEGCHKCPICSLGDDSVGTYVNCQLGAFNYMWCHGCDEPDEHSYRALKTKRHPDCPLILIERWRLESCATCSGVGCQAFTSHEFTGATCEDWQPK